MQKKKLLTITLASTLAATLVAGAGTFAYLSANTGTITNKFGKSAEGEDYLQLKLEETGVILDAKGNGDKSYIIKAGEQDDKDPTAIKSLHTRLTADGQNWTALPARIRM